MVLHVSNINLHVHYQHLNLEEARTTFERAVTADPLLSDLANMQIGVYTDGMRVAGVPVSIDAFVAKKARAQAKQDKVHVNRGRTRTNQGFGVWSPENDTTIVAIPCVCVHIFRLCSRNAPATTVTWVNTPSALTPSLTSASSHLPTLQDKQHSNARARKSKARETRGKVRPHKGQPAHSQGRAWPRDQAITRALTIHEHQPPASTQRRWHVCESEDTHWEVPMSRRIRQDPNARMRRRREWSEIRRGGMVGGW